MTYHFINGVTKDKRKIRKSTVVVLGLFLIVGLYTSAVFLWPKLPPGVLAANTNIAERLLSEQPGELGDRLFIPQINQDLAINQGDAKALDDGAWWSAPENGNPKEGGNFALSAYHFRWGLTPQQSRNDSPFYHLDKLQIDDEVFVDYDGVRYVYKVTNKYPVPDNVNQIEQRSEQAKLTLYATNSFGGSTGSEVIEAKPVGAVAWGDSPKIVPLEDTLHQDDF
jgi:sortase (surface protein transpeptidase)